LGLRDGELIVTAWPVISGHMPFGRHLTCGCHRKS
jgi:hypothetical protein